MSSAVRDWDAASYQRVSVPHEEWARAVLDRLAAGRRDRSRRRLRHRPDHRDADRAAPRRAA